MIEIKNKKIYNKQLKIILNFLKINEEENINIYIDDFKENSLFIDKDCSKIYIKDNENRFNALVSLLIKYKFANCVYSNNKNADLLKLLSAYFSNLKIIELMLTVNEMNEIKEIMLEIWGEDFAEKISDDYILNHSHKLLCINILKKFDEDYFMKNNLDISKYLEFYYILKDLDIEDIENRWNELEIYFKRMLGE
ncbi:UNVERIFIED_ORG: hypothetical protein B2H93_14815 [Clostridium botulinum]